VIGLYCLPLSGRPGNGQDSVGSFRRGPECWMSASGRSATLEATGASRQLLPPANGSFRAPRHVTVAARKTASARRGGSLQVDGLPFTHLCRAVSGRVGDPSGSAEKVVCISYPRRRALR
jgi:hypothetical protein